MKVYKTNYESFVKSLFKGLNQSLIGPWKRRSLGLLSLLIGYYIGGNLTAYFLESTGQRPLVVFLMVLIIEILVRLRSNVTKYPWPLFWLVIDNLRIGSVYAVVLEAFKLGS